MVGSGALITGFVAIAEGLVAWGLSELRAHRLHKERMEEMEAERRARDTHAQARQAEALDRLADGVEEHGGALREALVGPDPLGD